METKKCTKCEKQKNVENFSFKNKEKNKRTSICNECQREYKNRWYHKHSENKEKFRIQSNITRKKLRQKMIDFLKDKSCIDCGEKDFVTFEFDHREVEKKQSTISKMVNDCYSWDKISQEINKCDIRCANCHRKKTAKQFGYYKMLNIF